MNEIRESGVSKAKADKDKEAGASAQKARKSTA